MNIRRPRRDSGSCRTWFSGLDARAKLLGVCAFVTVTALLGRTDLLASSVLAAVTLALASRVPLFPLARAYAVALPFIALASVSVFLFAGIGRGIDMIMRTSSCVLALLVMASGTETFDLFAGLRRLRVPALLTTILILTQKYVGILSDDLSRMTIARRARGFKSGSSLLDRYGLTVLSQTAGMVFVRSYGRAQRTYDGMRSRGFDGHMSSWRPSRMQASDTAFVVVMLAASTILIALQAGVAP